MEHIIKSKQQANDYGVKDNEHVDGIVTTYGYTCQTWNEHTHRHTNTNAKYGKNLKMAKSTLGNGSEGIPLKIHIEIQSIYRTVGRHFFLCPSLTLPVSVDLLL